MQQNALSRKKQDMEQENKAQIIVMKVTFPRNA